MGVGNLISLLAHSKEDISRPAALTLANLALDPEGVDAIMKDPSGAAVSALIGLLQVRSVRLPYICCATEGEREIQRQIDR